MKDFTYLLQGKLIKAKLSDNRFSFLLTVLIPKNINEYCVAEAPLFEEVTLEFPFEKLITGYLNNDLTVNLEDNDIILNQFQNRCFLTDYGTPKTIVDDIEIPDLINVHINNENSKKLEVELIVPIEENNMPYIKFTFPSFTIKDENNNTLDYSNLVESMRVYYEDEWISRKDRRNMEWEYLYGIKNSRQFYENKLSNNVWFQHQFNSNNTEPKIKKSLGELTLPLWLEIEPNSLKWDEFGNIDDMKIIGATKSKAKVLTKENFNAEILWLPPVYNSYSILTFLANELINCELDNPFQHILDLYISKWFPTEFIDTTLAYDLGRIIDADQRLSKHSKRISFFQQLNQHITERKLVEL